MLEIIEPLTQNRKPLKAILFDFDGTLSTLRSGWEAVMSDLMHEILIPEKGDRVSGQSDMAEKIATYIDTSTGIQTIFQMQWLAEQVRAAGRQPLDPWDYKAEYNRRLMQTVSQRRAAVSSGREQAERFMVAGSRAFLESLRKRDLQMYVASGTDQADVVAEARILGLDTFFKEIVGAPPGQARCSKELVVRRLLSVSGLQGEELAVIGDGKVEIGIAREAGAIALGLAADEVTRSGVNPDKRRRLIAAGAQAITGDFLEPEELLEWMAI
ncbi:MAG: HAD family hydrolase [Bacillota bacterium]|nr:HAD family hydrolase [Bacillota bacterium]